MIYPKGSTIEITVIESINKQECLLIYDYFYRATGGNFIHSSGVMIPRQIFNELGVFLVGEHYGEDLEMWARIALGYPIGYDTRILFSYYQTPSNDKPRFNNKYRCDPKIKMLEDVVTNTVCSSLKRQVISSHIANYLGGQCLSSIIAYTRESTVEMMKCNNAYIWTPFLNRLVTNKSLWFFLRIIAWVNRVLRSRIVLKALGGKKRSQGVLERIRI